MINIDELHQRLQILKEADMLSEVLFNKVLDVITLVVDRCPSGTQEQFEIFTTHFAIALNRIENGEEDFPINEQIASELSSSDGINDVTELLKEIETIIQFNIPDGERNLIIMHLLNMIERR